MKYYFSASTVGFYVFEDPSEYPNLPSDIVEITQEEWQSLLDGQANGKIISSDSNGNPILIDPPPPTEQELKDAAFRKRDQLLTIAALRIAPLQDAVDLDDATPEEVALLKSWKQFRVALNRIEQQAGFPTTIVWPVPPVEINLALRTEAETA